MAMFSKKHYAIIADIIAKQVLTDKAHKTLVLDFADTFQEDNRNFERHKFMKACGILVQGV